MTDKTDRTLGGGISRRKVLGGAAVAVGVGAGLVATAAYAKTSQADAKYQDSPKNGQKCGACSQFTAPNQCKLVDGNVSENGWCMLYTPKSG